MKNHLRLLSLFLILFAFSITSYSQDIKDID